MYGIAAFKILVIALFGLLAVFGPGFGGIVVKT